MADTARIAAGLALVREGRGFDAHELFEELWRAAEPAERDLYQGLVHVAVATYQDGARQRGRPHAAAREGAPPADAVRARLRGIDDRAAARLVPRVARGRALRRRCPSSGFELPDGAGRAAHDQARLELDVQGLETLVVEHPHAAG